MNVVEEMKDNGIKHVFSLFLNLSVKTSIFFSFIHSLDLHVFDQPMINITLLFRFQTSLHAVRYEILNIY